MRYVLAVALLFFVQCAHAAEPLKLDCIFVVDDQLIKRTLQQHTDGTWRQIRRQKKQAVYRPWSAPGEAVECSIDFNAPSGHECLGDTLVFNVLLPVSAEKYDSVGGGCLAY